MDTAAVLGPEYRPRVIDGALQRALAASGTVVIEGARASGKTMTALHAAASYVFIDDSEVQRLLEVAPRSLLDGEAPKLLGKWQVALELWNLVRRAVDSAVEPGRFILTGSSVPPDDVTRHTGAGRFLRLRQRTMSWWEKLEVPRGEVSLSGLFGGDLPTTDLDAPPISTRSSTACYVLASCDAALSPVQASDRLHRYIDDVARTDINRIADIRHKPEVVKQLLAAIARSVACEVTYKTLATDVRAVAPTIDVETVSNYVGLLQRVFIVEAQRPWAPRCDRARGCAPHISASGRRYVPAVPFDLPRWARHQLGLGHVGALQAVELLSTSLPSWFRHSTSSRWPRPARAPPPQPSRRGSRVSSSRARCVAVGTSSGPHTAAAPPMRHTWTPARSPRRDDVFHSLVIDPCPRSAVPRMLAP